MPYFVRVGNGQTFTAIGITVFLDKFTHQQDSFTGSGTTLQCYTLQFFNHEHAFRITQFTFAGDGRFTDTQLLFVHTRVGGIHESVCLTDLRNFTLYGYLGHVGNPFGMHASIIDGHGRILFISLGRYHVYPCTVPTVACMAGDD